MRLLRLPEKGKRYQSGPTYWKTNFSLSSRKENLSPQEFSLCAEQRLETAPGNCTAMLLQIREEPEHAKWQWTIIVIEKNE